MHIQSNTLSQHSGISHYITEKPTSLRCPRYTWEDKMRIDTYKQEIQEEIRVDTLIIPDQTHSSTCIEVTEENISKNFYSDALYTQEKNIALFVLASDCVPILLYDPVTKSIGVIHAGRKGLEWRIIWNTVSCMEKAFLSKASDIVAYIWPHISQENYEVSEEQVSMFREQYGKYIRKNTQHEGKYFLDIWTIAVKQIEEIWILASNIERSELCTYKEDELLHSYRRKTHTWEESYGNNGFWIWLK